MINALIRKGDQTAILSLPADRFSLQYDLAQIGIRQRLTEIPIHDDEEQEISVKLFADSDIGNSLAVLFNSAHSLDDANLCAHMVENARPELQEEIEQHKEKWICRSCGMAIKISDNQLLAAITECTNAVIAAPTLLHHESSQTERPAVSLRM